MFNLENYFCYTGLWEILTFAKKEHLELKSQDLDSSFLFQTVILDKAINSQDICLWSKVLGIRGSEDNFHPPLHNRLPCPLIQWAWSYEKKIPSTPLSQIALFACRSLFPFLSKLKVSFLLSTSKFSTLVLDFSPSASLEHCGCFNVAHNFPPPCLCS